jgi:hypothetical protein
VHDDLVANQPAIHEKEHGGPVVFLNVRARCENVNLQSRSTQFPFVLDQFVEKVISKDLKDSLAESGNRGR